MIRYALGVRRSSDGDGGQASLKSAGLKVSM